MKTKHRPQEGLTTTQAPFIEEAKSEGEIFIEQPYELYSKENQEAWQKLFDLMQPKWKKFANTKFLNGIASLSLQRERIPKIEEINQFLKPLTGFQAKAVSGYVATYQFFDSLKNRQFPTTITIRDHNRLNYLPEPDIFHDVAGHVPMHTDTTFATILVKFGALANRAALLHKEKEMETRVAKIKSNIQALSRFFWFTVEFGLIREKGELKVYGSGLLSSAGEIEHSIVSDQVQRYPFQLEWVINQSFEIDHYQPLLFVIDSFEQLYDEVGKLEEWLNSGKLDFVAPGEPSVDEENLKAFLHF